MKRRRASPPPPVTGMGEARSRVMLPAFAAVVGAVAAAAAAGAGAEEEDEADADAAAVGFVVVVDGRSPAGGSHEVAPEMVL